MDELVREDNLRTSTNEESVICVEEDGVGTTPLPPTELLPTVFTLFCDVHGIHCMESFEKYFGSVL